MKVTWFSDDAFRVHLGGKIVVLNPESAVGAEPRELVSGADIVVSNITDLPRVDGLAWKPDRVPSAVFDTLEPSAAVVAIDGGILISCLGEPPLVLLRDVPHRLGRWVHDAVIVPLGRDPQRIVSDIIRDLAPALIALREADFASLDRDTLLAALDGTALQVLEPGLGIEFA